MVDLKKDDKSQDELNAALEMLHFGFRAITAQPDQRLRAKGYSRVHHRILYFIGRNPDTSINQLLTIMKVSKQYLNNPLKKLIADGFIEACQDTNDKRVKRLRLSGKGRSFEKTLTGEQREQLAEIFSQSGSQAESGWRKVMTLLAEISMNN